MATSTLTERFAPSVRTYNYYGRNISAHRGEGTSEAVMSTYGRTNAAERQEVADSMATITETATVERVDINNYLVHFRVTHRILPIEVEHGESEG